MLYGQSKSAGSSGHFKFHTKWDATALGAPVALSALKSAHLGRLGLSSRHSLSVRTRTGVPEDTGECPAVAPEDTDLELSWGENGQRVVNTSLVRSWCKAPLLACRLSRSWDPCFSRAFPTRVPTARRG